MDNFSDKPQTVDETSSQPVESHDTASAPPHHPSTQESDPAAEPEAVDSHEPPVEEPAQEEFHEEIIEREEDHDRVPLSDDISPLPEIEAVESTTKDIPLEPPALDENVEFHSRPPRQNRQGGGDRGGRGHGGGHNSHGGNRQGGEHGRSPNFFRPRPNDDRRKASRPPEKETKKEILVNCSPEETRVAVVEDDKLIELLVERTESEKIVGNIYKGRIENVLPGISSAFINIGLEKNAYLYVSDVVPLGKHQASSQIEKMIARNEIVMLQVAKEAIGTKGVKVTMDISLPGRHLVYMPLAEHLGVSKNIEDRKERDRLRTIIESCAPEKGGVIIRTEADGADEQALRREMAYLIRLWESIQKRFESAPTPSLVHRDLGLVFQTVRDVFTEATSIFLVDSRNEFRDLMDFLDSVSPEMKARVKLYEGKTPLFQAYKIEPQIETIRNARVDLPSGGYIIIQEAEGLCAIDVNTGKFTGKRSQEETVTATNVEAAVEVARQLRLRNIGGIIVIDFIDMRHARNRQKVMEALAHYTREDRAKIKILPITRLGLIEMTRERKRESLFALLGEACPSCHASGRVLSRDSMYIRLKREILTMTHGRPGNHIKIFLSPTVASYFQERQARLEAVVKHKLIITQDPYLPWEEYRILIE